MADGDCRWSRSTTTRALEAARADAGRPARRRHRRGRPVHHPVHQRHHRAPQGRDAHRTATSSTSRSAMRATARRASRCCSATSPPPAPDAPPPASICAHAVLPHLRHCAAVHDRRSASGMHVVFPPPGRWDADVHLELTAEHRVDDVGGRAHPVLAHARAPRLRLATTCRALAQRRRRARRVPPELMRVLDERIPTRGPVERLRHERDDGRRAPCCRAERYEHAPRVGRARRTPRIEVQIRDDGPQRRCPRARSARSASAAAVVFLGYWDNPEATAAALDDERWYRTGDFGRIDDGVLYLESRMRDLIIRGGENIYPIEIEHRLVEHPDIADAAVDRRRPPQARPGGQGRSSCCTDGASLEPADVQEWVAAALAAFKVPTYVRVPRRAAVQRQTGKVHEARAWKRSRPRARSRSAAGRPSPSPMPSPPRAARRPARRWRRRRWRPSRPGRRASRRRGRPGSRAGPRAWWCATW